MAETKTVTLAEVAAAIQKNGFKKAQTWVEKDPITGCVVAACAIGQAAINLGVEWDSLDDELHTVLVFDGGDDPMTLSSWIIRQNDKSNLTVGEIGRLTAKRVAALGAMPLKVTTATYKT